MRTITFEHRTNEWYDGDNPNEWDNYDSNQTVIDLTDGYWEATLETFIRFLNTSGFRTSEGKHITATDVIFELGGYSKDYVNLNFVKKSKEVYEDQPRKVVSLSPGVSAWEYDG